MREMYCMSHMSEAHTSKQATSYVCLLPIGVIKNNNNNMYNGTEVCPSACPSLTGKNRLRDENGKGTIGCGSGIGLYVGRDRER